MNGQSHDRLLTEAEASVFAASLRHAREHKNAACPVCKAAHRYHRALSEWGRATGENAAATGKAKPSQALAQIAREVRS